MFNHNVKRIICIIILLSYTRIWRTLKCVTGGERIREVTSEEVLERVGEERILLINILRRKANSIVYSEKK